jgi:hypothetical protein
MEDPAFDGLNWYVYAGNNPLLYLDPCGLAMVQLREWYNEQYGALQTYFGSNNVSGALNWSDASRTASASMAARGNSGYAEFQPGVNGSYIDPSNGRLYVDDAYLWAAFGNVIDPGLKTDWVGEGLIVAGSIGLAKAGIAAGTALLTKLGIIGAAAGGAGTTATVDYLVKNADKLQRTATVMGEFAKRPFNASTLIIWLFRPHSAGNRITSGQ